ncbi:hypothetical protein IW261DRAFT_1597908 [Armillaria novae-zelandiae]|uniref:F-box domain-containing protein n=1 Tax=Armillaria novae-zelandiae TaxID=153914 RepID=A0AA39TWX5_9AGAR|nr:hypothetical protein IW261DRAFT_1597908 [Armillaria novae-zelandiae]
MSSSSLSIDGSPRPHQTRPVAPIDALPNELLLDIFAFGADDAGDTNFSFLVSAICHSWRSLAINDSRLWTSVTMTVTAAINRLPVPAEEIVYCSEVFPKECTILERSADRDFDFYLDLEDVWEHPEGPDARDSFIELHLFVLSELLAWYAHRMRSFHVTMLGWEPVADLCSLLHGIAMPRLDTWDVSAVGNECYYIFQPTYEHTLGYHVDPIHVLELHDLQGSRRLLQPALEHVRCTGIPLNWELFSPSNLKTLRLGFQPSDERVSMETLCRILWNSKDTLEHLEFTDILDVRSEAPVPNSRLVLKHVTHLALGRMDSTYGARAVLQGFEFPALRTLVIEGTPWARIDEVFVDVLKYIQVEDLLNVKFARISVDCSEGDADGTAEESTPLILQLFRRLSRGSLQRLTVDDCCDGFLNFMKYQKEIGRGRINLSQLKALTVRVWTSPQSEIIVSFLPDRLELGSVNGSYIGPVLEQLTLVMDQSFEGEVEGLAELAKEMQITYNVVVMSYTGYPIYYKEEVCIYETPSVGVADRGDGKLVAKHLEQPRKFSVCTQMIGEYLIPLSVWTATITATKALGAWKNAQQRVGLERRGGS